MTKRSMHGNPVLPMMIRKVPRSNRNTASWKDNMESGVRVNPRSLNKDGAVKIPLRNRLATKPYLDLVYTPPNPGNTSTIDNWSVCAAADYPRNQTYYTQSVKKYIVGWRLCIST